LTGSKAAGVAPTPKKSRETKRPRVDETKPKAETKPSKSRGGRPSLEESWKKIGDQSGGVVQSAQGQAKFVQIAVAYGGGDIYDFIYALTRPAWSGAVRIG
jgi:hypothetical protein